jgi:hypothetical protein
VSLEYAGVDEATASRIEGMLERDVAASEAFIGTPYPSGFSVRIYPTREALTSHWRSAWNQPSLQPQCWMIASGSRAAVSVLSPRIWSQENCGHEGSSDAYVERVITHEMIHVLHAQINSAPDINAVQETKWLNEGVAVLASGQLDAAARQQVRQLAASGFRPASLAAAWTGSSGYGVSGSLALYLDTQWGREVLRAVLTKASNADILAVLGVTESALLEGWRAFAAATS